jgi:hypothetical protein
MRNDYRVGKKVLHVVVDVDLHLAVKLAAAEQGVSVTELVTRILDKEVSYGDAGIGSGHRVGSASSGGANGAYGGGSGAGHSQSGASGRRVDWEELLAVGRAAKTSTAVLDPIEEIA